MVSHSDAMNVVARLRSSFVAGIILVTPLAVTVFVLDFAFDRLTIVLNPIVRATGLAAYTGNIQAVAHLVAAVLLALALTLLGYVASAELGRRFFGGFERGLRLVPLVRTIYFGVRQVSESLTRQTEGFDRVVLVEYPREGLYSLGFVTNGAPAAAEGATETDLFTVFVPNSPNPTAGALVMVREDEVYELDMSVRQGLRLVVTTGLAVDDPADLPPGVVR
jgi:uncharacterized membrane protein